jgi:hypothetical protein
MRPLSCTYSTTVDCATRRAHQNLDCTTWRTHFTPLVYLADQQRPNRGQQQAHATTQCAAKR